MFEDHVVITAPGSSRSLRPLLFRYYRIPRISTQVFSRVPNVAFALEGEAQRKMIGRLLVGTLGLRHGPGRVLTGFRSHFNSPGFSRRLGFHRKLVLLTHFVKF